MGQGAYRISARDFYEEVERTEKQIREINERERGEKRNYLLDYAREEDAREMEKVRLGKTTEKQLKNEHNSYRNGIVCAKKQQKKPSYLLTF